MYIGFKGVELLLEIAAGAYFAFEGGYTLFKCIECGFGDVAVGNFSSEVAYSLVEVDCVLSLCSLKGILEILDLLHQSKVLTLQDGVLIVVCVLAGCESAHAACQRGEDEHSANDFLHLESEY